MPAHPIFILINTRQALHNTSWQGGALKTSHTETHQHGSRYTRSLHARSRSLRARLSSGSGVVSGVGLPSGVVSGVGLPSGSLIFKHGRPVGQG